MREIVLDTETTGLDFRGGDRVIEVGCVELINHVRTGKDLQFYCSVDKKINESATKIHGLTNGFLNKHKNFKQNAHKLMDFIKKDILIIHNAEFDLGFLNNELNLINLPPLENKVVDTVLLARKTLNTRIANLDHLCKRFDIDLSSRKLHGALLDCNLLADVYLELKGGKQTAFELKNEGQKTSMNGKKPTKNTEEIAEVKINEEEIEAHKTFVKNIKNALWNKLDY